MRRSNIVLAAILAICGLGADGAMAADVVVFQIGGGKRLISLSGQIAPEDSQKFLAVARSVSAAFVFLAGPGGSIKAAVQIGDIVRSMGMTTIVAKGQYCTSACGLIWLAGQRRLLTPTSRVGFHTAYVVRNGSRVGSADGNALIGRYIARLALPQQSFAFATAAGPDDLAWLDTSNQQQSGIDHEIVDTERNGSFGLIANEGLPAFIRGTSASPVGP